MTMNHLPKIVACVALLVAAPCLGAAPPESAAIGSAVVAAPLGLAKIPGTVVEGVDGDTCDVEFRVVVRVRLLAGDKGCWADEAHLQSSIKDPKERVASRDRGLAATKSLEDKALGKPCLVTIPLTSSRVIDYLTLERLLANIEVDGDNLGEYQIRTKHASSTKGGKLGL